MKLARLAITIAYPVLLVLSSLNFAPPVLKVLLLIAPLTFLLNIGISKLSDPRHRMALRIFVGLVAVLVGIVLFRLRHENLKWLVVLQECGVLLIMACVFGITLVSGGDALCTRFVRLAHENPSDQLIRYSRQITAAWAFFFLISAAISTTLYYFQPMHIWALYNSVGIPVCAIIFFYLENLSQRIFLPRDERRSITEVLRTVRAAQINRHPLGPI